jgi:hypothetical protein
LRLIFGKSIALFAEHSDLVAVIGLKRLDKRHIKQHLCGIKMFVMKKLVSLFIFFSIAALVSGQKVFMAESVSKSAKWAKLPYEKAIKKAIKGDPKAMVQVFEVFSVLEGKDIDRHARTCLEIMQILGDSVCSKVIFLKTEPKLKAFLLTALPRGQGLVEIEELKQPLYRQFPVTWATMNGDFDPYQQMHCASCRSESQVANEGQKTKESIKPKPVEDDEIDKKLIRNQATKPIVVPPDVEELIDQIIKKQESTLDSPPPGGGGGKL